MPGSPGVSGDLGSFGRGPHDKDNGAYSGIAIWVMETTAVSSVSECHKQQDDYQQKPRIRLLGL